NPSSPGQSVTFTAKVGPNIPGKGTPTGTVYFVVNGSVRGTGTLSGGAAPFSTTSPAAGHNANARIHSGATKFLAGKASVLTPAVLSLPATSAAVSSSGNPAVFGQKVTFTATVKPVSGTGVPTGTVTFRDAGTTLGTATLTNGTASFSTTFTTVATHSITVGY